MDLDTLLDEPPTSDMAAVADALEAGHAEQWQVALIRRYLITDAQRAALFAAGMCEHDVLNGHNGNFDPAPIFQAWNATLGRRVFGY